MSRIENAIKIIHCHRVEDHLLTNKEEIANHVADHFKHLFNRVSILQDHGLVDKVIPNVVTEQENNLLTMMPLMEEVHNVVFSLKKDSESGLMGLSLYSIRHIRALLKKMSTRQHFNYLKKLRFYPTITSTLWSSFPRPKVETR